MGRALYGMRFWISAPEKSMIAAGKHRAVWQMLKFVWQELNVLHFSDPQVSE